MGPVTGQLTGEFVGQVNGAGPGRPQATNLLPGKRCTNALAYEQQATGTTMTRTGADRAAHNSAHAESAGHDVIFADPSRGGQLASGIRMTTLANGLRVATHHMPHLQTASLGIWVATGARSETAERNGLSHLLEHMAFKGTTRRSAAEIAEEIENVGGDLNAATSYEVTAYYARVLKDDVRLGLELLGDIICDARLGADDLEREKHVVEQEIAGVSDMPDEILFDVLQRNAYPDQALGRPILGSLDTVRALQTIDLRTHLAERYRLGDMIVSAAGHVDHAQIVDIAAQLAERLPQGHAAPVAPARFKGMGCAVDRPIEQAHVSISFDGVSFRSPDFFAAQVLSGLLGGGISSRLFQQAREERGLCYSIYSFASGYSDAGMFGVYAGTAPDAVEPLMGVVWGELNALRHGGPRQDEIDRAKAQLKAGLLMSLESSGARAEQMARHLLAHGRVLTPEELIARVDAVTADDVQRLTAGFLEQENIAWAVVSPRASACDPSAITAGRA